MTLAQFKEKRAELLAEMQNIVDTRSENMDDATLNTVKTLKDEIKGVDSSIDAIETLRSTIKGDAVETASTVDENEQRSQFDAFMRGKSKNNEIQLRSMMSGTPAKGAESVPDDFLRELFKKIAEFGSITQDARHITTGDNGELTLPIVDDTANKGVWTAEGADITKVDFSTSKLTLNSFKVATGIQVSTEFLEDAFFNVEGYISEIFAERLGETLELAYIGGSGSGQPTGIATNTASVSEVTFTAGTPPTIAEVEASLKLVAPAQRAGMKIYASDAVISAWQVEKDSNGRPLLQPQATATDASAGLYMIAGYPVVPNYTMNGATAGEVGVVIGNMKNYIVRDIRSLTIKRDDYSDMAKDMVNFYATMRVDANVINPNKCFVVFKAV